MANAAVVECYGTLVEGFNTLRSNGTRHRGADYRRAAGQTIVAYEDCVITNSDFYSSVLGYCVTARRVRDGKAIGWAHVKKGTRPAVGTLVKAGGSIGIVAGWGDNPGSAWSGPHIHTTEDDGNDWTHIYQGTNSDPVPDITAAKGASFAVTNYHWYKLTKEAMTALQKMLNAVKLYGGVTGGTGPVDGDFGKFSVMGVQAFLRRQGFLPGDYKIDGVPHNLDQNAPSAYGHALQKWAKMVAGYNGLMDGLPGAYTSQFIVQAANKVTADALKTPVPIPVPEPEPSVIPVFPPAPEGYVFMPDLGSSQSGFDFAEFKLKGGAWAAIKMGGANTSDSPYIAPAYKDQYDRATAQGIRLVHYWFNGRKNNLTPEKCADFFYEESHFKPGHVAAIDIEDEKDTSTTAWTPAEAVRYVKRLREWYPGIKGLFYLSLSVYQNNDWSELEAMDWEPWIASWGANTGDPGTNPPGDEIVWQYTSVEKVPGNYTVQSGKKVYGNTDGNLARADLFEKLAWVVPTEPEPQPEPEPEPDKYKQFYEDVVELVNGMTA